MRYTSRATAEGRRLIAEDARGDHHDLTSADRDLATYGDLARRAANEGASVDGAAEELLPHATPAEPDPDRLAPPVVAEEVWAAGVTYHISEAAREAESEMPEIYLDVYDADRPELFFKATPSRTVGPGEAIGIRADSDWDVPEPELGLVLYEGETVGYTVGNDVSSRAIEGRNPLYLPQAKVYDRCCAIGPCVATGEAVADPTDLEMSMAITRDGETVFDEATSTAEMVREPDDLVAWLSRHNRLPEVCVLLTGTSLVPPDEFTLAVGDVVAIDIEGIGTLSNTVVEV